MFCHPNLFECRRQIIEFALRNTATQNYEIEVSCECLEFFNDLIVIISKVSGFNIDMEVLSRWAEEISAFEYQTYMELV